MSNTPHTLADAIRRARRQIEVATDPAVRRAWERVLRRLVGATQ